MFYDSIFNNGSGAFRETGALRFFLIPKGALTHHLPAGQVVAAFPLVRPCALRGELRSLWRAPANAAGTAVPVIIVCAEGSLRRFPRLRKPATGSFVADMDDASPQRPFSFVYDKRNKTAPYRGQKGRE